MSSSRTVAENNEINKNRWDEQSRRETFRCENPDHPHMRSFTNRMDIFGGFRSNAAAPVSELADAGLFYLGNEDRTKCFYCSGCLMNWQQNDNPMEEHAKWFPECEYVLRKRGCEYVTSISEKYPDIVRPEIPTHHHQPSSIGTQQSLTGILHDPFACTTFNMNDMFIQWLT